MVAGPNRGGSRERVTIVWSVFVAVGITAFVLGWHGMTQYLARVDQPAYSGWDVLYFVLQLYVLGAEPLENLGGKPVALELARFMAPLFTLLTVVETGRILLAGEVRRLRARMARRHAVVCGDTAFAKALAEQLFATGRRVVVVRSQPFGSLELRHRRMLGVPGDPRSPAVLRGAGIRRARHLYVCGDDDQVNHAVAVAASTELQHRRLPPWIYVQLNRQQTCASLQARRLGAAGSNRFRLDYFHVDDVAARMLYRRHPLRRVSGRPIRLLLAGDGSFPRVLLVETARYWRDLPGTAREQLQVDVIGPDATRTVAALAARFPFLDTVCRINRHNESLDTWLPRISGHARYDRIYLSYRDEQWMLDLALERPDLWQAVTEAVFVATYANAALADAFHGGEFNDLLDEVNGKLQVYPIITRACDAQLISDDLTERLARQIHQRYLRAARGRPSAASSVDWSRLSESMRNANRAQVQGIATKLQALGCVIAVRNGEDGLITTHEVERLAVLEHLRWCAERSSQGWRFGTVRDDRRRRHPDLVAWAALSDDSKEKARDAVRWMTEVLADEGFTIVRLTEEPVGAVRQ